MVSLQNRQDGNFLVFLLHGALFTPPPTPQLPVDLLQREFGKGQPAPTSGTIRQATLWNLGKAGLPWGPLPTIN